MGSVKIIAIKSLGDELMEQFSDRFTGDFEHNKKVLAELKPIKYKRVRNSLAGYISNQMKERQKSV